MKILLFGPHGQVGFELQRALAPLGQVVSCDRSKVDLSNALQLERFILDTAPDVIVNAAAYTQADRAQSEAALVASINTQAPAVMAKVAKQLNSLLIHYSTDYIFDGRKTEPYTETDMINPLNVYGETKAKGEAAIRETGCRHVILRISWVYATRGRNFLRTILEFAQTREKLSIVDDQIGAPTSAEFIADITALMLYRLQWDPALKNFHSDTFHLTAGGQVNRHEYARFILSLAEKNDMPLKVSSSQVIGVPTSTFPTPAVRPLNSLLDSQKISQQFGVILPDWQYHVIRTVAVITKGANQ